MGEINQYQGALIIVQYALSRLGAGHFPFYYILLNNENKIKFNTRLILLLMMLNVHIKLLLKSFV